MSSITVTAHADEPLDLLVWRALGTYPGTVETTLDANPGLARLGPALPEGTIVTIPLPVAPTQVAPLVQLWS